MYAVVEFNQASHMPDDTAWLRDSLDDARELAAYLADDAAIRGRRDWYQVFELTEVDLEGGSR
jgi:hypothetical protein